MRQRRSRPHASRGSARTRRSAHANLGGRRGPSGSVLLAPIWLRLALLRNWQPPGARTTMTAGQARVAAAADRQAPATLARRALPRPIARDPR